MLYKEKNTVNTENIKYKHITDKLPKLNEEEKRNVEREINIEDLKYISYTRAKIIRAQAQMASQMNLTKSSGIKFRPFYYN